MNKCSYCLDFNFLDPPEYDHLLSFTEEMWQKNASPHIGTRCWKLHSVKTLMFLMTIGSGPHFLGHIMQRDHIL